MILTWIRRELFVSEVCRQPFVESNVLGGKIEAVRVCMRSEADLMIMSAKPDFMVLVCYCGYDWI